MQPLALTYRPKRFADIVGQKPTRAVLWKLVESGTLPPSMIFAGVRGTGKTSAARILAKAINCAGEGVEPCGECWACEAVDSETSGFVVEIDAASHGGAEAMRELVADAMYSSSGHWKVYVLDEVHSLSSQGFQVLLKTLEEPPARTSFVLVTTEPEKIPDTIHARSMLFRFNKITQADIVGRLEYVVEAEGFTERVDVAALAWIAEQADGGMRDALMMLDQVHRLEKGVTVPVLQAVFGEQSVGRWIEALTSGNTARAVLVADELAAMHGSVGAMIDRALVTLRAVLLARAGVGAMPADMAGVRLGEAELIEMIRKLWKMRVEVRQLGPDDRAALVALSADLARHRFGAEEDEALSAEQIKEMVG